MNSVQLKAVDLNLLLLFDVVLLEKNVGRAARQLGLSPSAVSHGLSRLRRLFADPLFLRTPKGVVPTARASELAPAVADILARVRTVVSASKPFDARTSKRRFVLGMPDASAVTHLPALLARTRKHAPLIDISLRQLLPGEALLELDARKIDVALVALDDLPARFAAEPALEEEFVVAARSSHPFLRKPTLKRYCEAEHILMSTSGDAQGFVDDALRAKGRSRRVALTVPSFMLALAALEHSDLLSAVPLSLARTHGARFRVASVRAPFPLRPYTLRVITTRAALEDSGVAWLFDTVLAVARRA